MATLAAKAIRGAQANEVLSARLSELGKRIGVSMPEAVPRSPDPELQPILETERQIVFLDALLAALSDLAVRDEAPAGYESLTVMMLRQELIRRGIEIPQNAKKDDLILTLMEDDESSEGEGA